MYVRGNTPAHHGSYSIYYDTCPAVNTSAVRLESGSSFDRHPKAVLLSVTTSAVRLDKVVAI